MASKKISTLTARNTAIRSEADFIKSVGGNAIEGVRTTDSFQNFVAKLGMGTDNQTSFSTYGFNPITRIRILLEWIYRGSWIGGTAVNVVAEDMTRAGVNFKGELKPEDAEILETKATELRLWEELRDGVSWGRLYGGAVVSMLIDGQNMKTPLRIETVGEGQFKGLIALDRWMVEPSLNDLVTDLGPYLGLPKYYRVTDAAPALRGQIIHYTRVLRMEGIRLPYNQRMMENLWGISVLERLYDRMVAFDSATQGAAQLVYKSYIRSYAVEDLREAIAAGGPAMNGLLNYVQMMARFQSIEGVTLIDAKDRMESDTGGSGAIVGISDALNQFAGQLSGALGIPLVRLFGQSPAGFSTGDTDLRNYYDTIMLHQKSMLLVPVTNMYKCLAQSEGIKVPQDFGIEFKPLWQLSEPEKATIASTVTTMVGAAQEQGTIDRATALKELAKSSKTTGYWGHISKEDITEAEKQAALAPPQPTGVLEAETRAEGQESTAKIKTNQKEGRGESPEPKPPGGGAKKTKDSRPVLLQMWQDHDIQIVIENPAGTIREGVGWRALQPDDYGYIRKADGYDGDPLDCYVGQDAKAKHIYVIAQRNVDTGDFDEYKCMIGYPHRKAAEETYDMAYPNGGGMHRIMSVQAMTPNDFKQWMSEGRGALAPGSSPAGLQRNTVESRMVGDEDTARNKKVATGGSGTTTADEDYGATADFPGVTAQSGATFTHDDDFKESEHPRKADGKFAIGGSGLKSKTAVKTLKQTNSKAFKGESVELKSKISKQESGAIGENAVIAWLKKQPKFKDAGHAEEKGHNSSHFPVDVKADHHVFEIKTGLASNGKSAQQWRITVGEPGQAEKEKLAKMSEEKKRKYMAKKQAACINRKKNMLRILSEKAGRKIAAKTVTTILNPDTQTVDIYQFDGFHQRIAWNSPEAKKAYVGSYKYGH
jgi:phage-related protein (TIGR01555 family)